MKIYDEAQKAWYDIQTNCSVFTSQFLVTPEWAKDVLDNRNINNRRIEKRRVKKYARDMINSQWHITNDDITFDKNGNLLNGQHRLMAVIESQVAVTMSFKFGVNSKAVMAMDEGKQRSNLDIINMLNKNATRATLSCCNYILEQCRRKDVMPRDLILEFHDRHYEPAKFITEKLKSHFCRGPICAALTRAYYNYQDKLERLEQFINVLNTGIYEDAREDAGALRLRDIIIGRKDSSTGSGRDTLYRKTESAIRYFMKRENVTYLKGISNELFLLPEEAI